MKIKILAIVLFILFTCGLDLVIGEPPGGGNPPAGNCPCYYSGQVVCEYGWWAPPYYISIIETYIGGCQIRSDWFRNGQWFQYTVNAGGCTCACSVPEDPHQDD
ncbi:MAG: hypothetical protein NT166_27860 [Candidatus Aminicenantes bacterium]|nr:hypothetical protein [Candidatus Aminicenantes bacterium]